MRTTNPPPPPPIDRQRRRLLLGAGAGLVASLAPGALAAKPKPKQPDEDEVSPTEDLMREHGVLRRVLIVYDAVLRRLDAREPVPAEPLARAAHVIRAFIEEYHEKDEEEFVFPKLAKGPLGPLVATLRAQHEAGRRLTETVLRVATPAGLAAPAGPHDLAEALRGFNRMYRAHAAREDTVLFPAFREKVGEKELDRLKEVFEQREKALPDGGFEAMVAAVASIEEAFGIADLARFTPAK